MSDTNKKSMQKSTVQKKRVNESIASYGAAATKKRRSAMMIITVMIVFILPAPPAITPCTITCPARIVRKIAQRYPAVPKMIAASMI